MPESTPPPPPPQGPPPGRPPGEPPPLPPQPPQAVFATPPKPARRQPRRGPVRVYQADRGRAWTVRWLAGILALGAIFSIMPVVLGSAGAGNGSAWARAVLLVAVVQLAYAGWMAITPDWSTVWVATVAYAAVAAGYAAVTIVAMTGPADQPLPLGLKAARGAVAGWCTAVFALTALGAYLAGRLALKWRRWLRFEPVKPASKTRRGAGG